MLRALFEKRYHPSQDAAASLFYGRTAAGVDVTTEGSLQSTAVYACVRAIAESIASLPFHLYERLDRGKERATAHPLYNLLRFSPNPEMTSQEFREAMTGHMCLWGNAYANIEWLNSGFPGALWPLRPDRMSITRDPNTGELAYIYRLSKPDPDGSMERKLRAVDVWHIRGFSSNGIVGYSPIALAMQAVGLSMAAEEFGARFFGNGAAPGGVLEHPGVLGEEAQKNLRKSWNEMHSGLENTHRIAILEEGMSYKQVGIPPDQAQFLETRKFQVREIARMFRIPPHKIADLEQATFSNIEHMSIEFVTDTLMPWMTRWEQRVSLNLLQPGERSRYFAEHLVDGLLRGDMASRYTAYSVGRNGGWLSANDIRERENMNPVEGGDVYLVPLNMVPADQVGMDPVSTETPPAGEPAQRSLYPDHEERSKKAAQSRRRLANSYRRIYQDTAARILRMEANDVRREAEKAFGKRDYGQFSIWLEDYYRQFARKIMRQFEPIALAYGELVADEAASEVNHTANQADTERFIANYVGAYAYRHTQISEYRIRQAVKRAQDDGNLSMFDELDTELETWETGRAQDIAGEESTRFNNAVAVAVYGMAGIEYIRSIAFGKNCPYCSSLDGKVIGINSWMIAAGEEVKPDGVDKPLTSSTNLRHAPYHSGCLPGDSLVTPVGGVVAVSKRWFDGNLIIFRTASGKELSCTPNHPVLTPGGWVAADTLNVGSYVISGSVIQRAVTVNEQRKNKPTRMEDIAETFFNDPEMRSITVPTAAEDFHGDGGGSQVAIVRTNGNLGNGFYATRQQHLSEDAFVGRFDQADPLTRTCGHALLFESFDPALSGDVRGGGLSLPILSGHTAGTDLTGFAPVTDRDMAFVQDAPNYEASDVQLVSQRILGLSGEIFPDKVINIDVIPFSGHVYNLQTVDGFYIANGIITHNCDCMTVSA